MAGLTREQRAVREAERAARDVPEADGCVYMYRYGERAVVHENSVAIMEALGWSKVKPAC